MTDDTSANRPPEPERCRNCRFFAVGYSVPPTEGRCSRYPPTPFYEVRPVGQGFVRHYSPEVRYDFWCGEWQPRRETPR